MKKEAYLLRTFADIKQLAIVAKPNKPQPKAEAPQSVSTGADEWKRFKSECVLLKRKG